jgi:Bacterial Ig domain
MRKFLVSLFSRVCAALIVGLVIPAVSGYQSLTLSWDANQEPDVAGYILYYGDASGHYTNSIDVGNVTTTIASNLVDGVSYFFTVTAYNTSRLESAPSNEVTTKLNNPPIARPDVVIAAPNITTRFALGSFLRNDIDFDRDPITILGVSSSSTQSGSVLFFRGVIYYTPPKDFTGTDGFTYTVTDGKGGTSTAQATVNVQVPTKPTLMSSNVLPQGGGAIKAQFQGLPSFKFSVEASTDLKTWQPIGTATGDKNGLVEYLDANAASFAIRYYRITIP